MSEFILRKEAFVLKLAQKVPEPNCDECFLLYKEGAGEENSMIINHGLKYSSAHIRHRHYNKIITISLKEKNFQQQYCIPMDKSDFYFYISVKTKYAVQDVKKYFFQGGMTEGDIQRNIKKCIGEQNGKWSMKQNWELQNVLEDEIEKNLGQYYGVHFRSLEIVVRPDEAAAKMLQSNRDTAVEIHTATNKTTEQVAVNEQNERIIESERELRQKQKIALAENIKSFGILAPVMEEYFKGNLDGLQLNEYIKKVKMDEFNLVSKGLSENVLTNEEAFEKMNQIMGSQLLFKEEQQQLNHNKVPLEEKNAEEQEAKKEKEKELLTFSEGDFV